MAQNFSYFGFTMGGAEQLDEAMQLIQDLPSRDKLVEAAMKKSLKPVQKRAKELVPVESGDLRDSIRISKKISKAQAARDRFKGLVMYVGSNWPTAHLIEFGTSAHQIMVDAGQVLAGKWGSGGRATYGTKVDIPSVSKQPYLRPAFEEMKGQVAKDFGDNMWKEFERLIKRLNRQISKGKLTKAGQRLLNVK